MPRGGKKGNLGGAPKGNKSAAGSGAPKRNKSAVGNAGGAPKGNKSAVGSGPPKGNKSAVGNAGGAAPKGNINAASAEAKAKKNFLKGELLRKEGEYAAALVEYKIAAALDPSVAKYQSCLALAQWNSTYGSHGSITAEEYAICVSNATTAMKLGNSEAAYFRAFLLVRGPDGHGNALGMLGGEEQEFILDQFRARTLLPMPEAALSMACNDYGAVLMFLNRLADAELILQKALASDPQNFKAMTNFAGCFEHTGRFDEAADLYSKALKIRPRFAPALLGLKSAQMLVAWRQQQEALLDPSRPSSTDAAASSIPVELTAAAMPRIDLNDPAYSETEHVIFFYFFLSFFK